MILAPSRNLILPGSREWLEWFTAGKGQRNPANGKGKRKTSTGTTGKTPRNTTATNCCCGCTSPCSNCGVSAVGPCFVTVTCSGLSTTAGACVSSICVDGLGNPQAKAAPDASYTFGTYCMPIAACQARSVNLPPTVSTPGACFGSVYTFNSSDPIQVFVQRDTDHWSFMIGGLGNQPSPALSAIYFQANVISNCSASNTFSLTNQLPAVGTIISGFDPPANFCPGGSGFTASHMVMSNAGSIVVTFSSSC